MNRFIESVVARDPATVKKFLETDEKWRAWAQPDGKNALHFLCGTPVVEKWNVPARELATPDPEIVEASLAVAKLLIKNGIDINSIHRIPDKNCDFPATPVWYAYTRGRNLKLTRWLLARGGSPANCMFAIAWNDDVAAAKLFQKHGLSIKDNKARDTPLLAAIAWQRWEIARWLFNNGADPATTDERGRTALDLARSRNAPPDIIEMCQ